MGKKELGLVLLLSAVLCSNTAALCQEPVAPQEPAPIERTSSQKGVGISTDVITIAMPVATLTYVLINQDWQGLKQGAFAAVTSLGATYILKYTVKKERPDLSDNHSFPSAHTSTMFANAAFLQRRYGWKFGAPAFVLATYVGWGRTYAKKHDWWDVVAGAAIGAGSAYIYTRPWSKKHELTLAPVSDGQYFGLAGSFKF